MDSAATFSGTRDAIVAPDVTTTSAETSPHVQENNVTRDEQSNLFVPKSHLSSLPADPEKGPDSTKEAAVQMEEDPNLVSWEGPTDPDNPRNWTSRKKWRSLIIVSCFTFIR
jgi:hypothetical protein